MKALLLDAQEFSYTPVDKEIDAADEAEKGKSKEYRDVLVAFVAIEKGDSESFFGDVVSDIKEHLAAIGDRKVLLYPYAHLSEDLAPSGEAKKLYGALFEALLNAGLNVEKAPFGWTKSFEIRIRGHPLAETLKTYKGKRRAAYTPKEKFYRFFVIDENGDEHEVTPSNINEVKPLQENDALRTFVINELIGKKEHHEEPAHIKYMKKLELVDYCPESDVGHLKWYPNGVVIRDLILDYAESIALSWGAIKMQNPLIYRTDVEAISMLQGEFHERDYKIEGENMVLRFASDPGAFPFVQKVSLSYRQMPFKVYEEAQCFRKEQSGEVVGLMRVRSFLMTDHHAFCASEEQARQEFRRLTTLFKELMDSIISPNHWVLGFEIVDEYYERYKGMFKELLREIKKPAFFKLMNRMTHYYAFKNEFQAIFPDGSNLQISTVQWDVKNGERFDIAFTDENGERKHVPFIIHASSFGSIERALASLLESAAWDEKSGKVPLLPFWLSPEQVRVIPVSERALKYAESVADQLESAGYRVGIDDRDMTLSKKVAEAKSHWVPVLAVVGEKEAEHGTANVVNRIGAVIGKEPSTEMRIDELKSLLSSLQGDKPKRRMYVSKYISRRPKFY